MTHCIRANWFKNLVFFIFFFAVLPADAKKENEAWYQAVWCESLGGEPEYRLDDRSRVDCLTPDYAVEMDFASKWREAIGQALHYARKTNREAGIVLVLKQSTDQLYFNELHKTLEYYQLPVKLWQLGPWEDSVTN